LKKKGQAAKADVAEGVSDTYVLTVFIDNTFTNKSWILNSDSAVHACS